MDRGTPHAAAAETTQRSSGILGKSPLDDLAQSTIHHGARGPPTAANPKCTCDCNPARLDKHKPKVAVFKTLVSTVSTDDLFETLLNGPAPLIFSTGSRAACTLRRTSTCPNAPPANLKETTSTTRRTTSAVIKAHFVA